MAFGIGYLIGWYEFKTHHGIIGTNQPLADVAKFCQRYEVLLHTDASQSGYLDISCHDLDVDFLTLSAHKIYGPSGIGLLYSKWLNHPQFTPMIYGGGQQNGLRAGTLPVPLIVGFATAVQILNRNKNEEAHRLMKLREALLHSLSSDLEIKVLGRLNDRHPSNLYLAIRDVDSMQLLNNLQPNVVLYLGSACDGLSLEYSLLIKALGVLPKEVLRVILE